MSQTHSVMLDDEAFDRSLESLINHPNRAALMRLFKELLISSNAKDYYVSFLLGAPYPEIPKAGDLVYVNVNEIWMDGSDRNLITASPLCQNGFLQCEMFAFQGLTAYNTCSVTYSLDGVITKTLHCKLANISLNKDDF
jgi:hypothetical protein